MVSYKKLKIGFIAASAVTVFSLIFYLQESTMTKYEIIDKGIITNIKKNIVKEYVVTYYNNKAEVTNLYPCAGISMPKPVANTSKWQPVHDDT